MALVMVHSHKGPNSEARALNAPEPKSYPARAQDFIRWHWTPVDSRLTRLSHPAATPMETSTSLSRRTISALIKRTLDEKRIGGHARASSNRSTSCKSL